MDKNYKEKLAEWAKFEKNWDSYNAEPINKEIMKEVEDMLSGLSMKTIEKLWMSPNFCCGISFEWKTKKNKKWYDVHVSYEIDLKDKMFASLFKFKKDDLSCKIIGYQELKITDKKSIKRFIEENI